MPHGIGVWPTTSRITLKWELRFGEKFKDPTFLLGFVFIAGLDQSWNPRRTFVLVRLRIQVSFWDMPCGQVSFGQMNILLLH